MYTEYSRTGYPLKTLYRDLVLVIIYYDVYMDQIKRHASSVICLDLANAILMLLIMVSNLYFHMQGSFKKYVTQNEFLFDPHVMYVTW